MTVSTVTDVNLKIFSFDEYYFSLVVTAEVAKKNQVEYKDLGLLRYYNVFSNNFVVEDPKQFKLFNSLELVDFLKKINANRYTNLSDKILKVRNNMEVARGIESDIDEKEKAKFYYLLLMRDPYLKWFGENDMTDFISKGIVHLIKAKM